MPDNGLPPGETRLRTYDRVFGYHLCTSMIMFVAGCILALGDHGWRHAFLAILPFFVVLGGLPLGLYVLVLSVSLPPDWRVLLPAGLLVVAATLMSFSGESVWPGVFSAAALFLYVLTAFPLSVHWFLFRRKDPDFH